MKLYVPVQLEWSRYRHNAAIVRLEKLNMLQWNIEPGGPITFTSLVPEYCSRMQKGDDWCISIPLVVQ